MENQKKVILSIITLTIIIGLTLQIIFDWGLILIKILAYVFFAIFFILTIRKIIILYTKGSGD